MSDYEAAVEVRDSINYLKNELRDRLKEQSGHLADIADSLRKIARSIEVTVAIEGGSSVPPLPPPKGEPS